MNEDNDRNIKVIFDQLRREEEQQSPSFHETLQGKNPAVPEANPWFGHWPRPAVVMLVLFMIAVPVIYNSLQEPAAIEISAEFENWESPTDFLLSFNDDPYLSEIPEIKTTIWEIEENQLIEN